MSVLEGTKVAVIILVLGALMQSCQATIRVGIIGSGITSASAAYWLRQQIPSEDDLHIEVFEREALSGGRLRAARVGDGAIVELGGAIIHPSNRYMMDYANLLNLTRRGPSYEKGTSTLKCSYQRVRAISNEGLILLD